MTRVNQSRAWLKSPSPVRAHQTEGAAHSGQRSPGPGALADALNRQGGAAHADQQTVMAILSRLPSQPRRFHTLSARGAFAGSTHWSRLVSPWSALRASFGAACRYGHPDRFHYT
jgi:hypothetical protein